jgi:hypothetical protein
MTLNLPYLTNLTNDLVLHDPNWPPVPTKLLSYIPKFEEKDGDDLANHVIEFHLWCSLNSPMKNSIRLGIFQLTLVRVAMKWYIELPQVSFHNFDTLAMTFLIHF